MTAPRSQMQQQPILHFTRGLTGRVDADKGIIYGVAVITEGEARGHNLRIDATTLSQVKAAADAFSGGVRVKLNHDGGVEHIIGNLDNFRIEGKKLLADLHLLKRHETFAQVIDLAQDMPEICGLSISVSGEPETKGKLKYLRCTELYSVDLVDEPAGNPSGLFSVRSAGFSLSPSRIDSKTPHSMTEENTILSRIKKLLGGDAGDDEPTVPKSAFTILETGHKTLLDAHAKLETDLAAGRLQVTNLEKEKTDLSAKVTALEAAAAKAKTDLEAAIKEHGGKEAASILAKLGVTPVPIVPDPEKDSKTLMQEFTEAKGADRQTLLNKYGADNIFRNVRKSP